MMPGRVSGVCLATLWNRTMEPGRISEMARRVISDAKRSRHSKLSLLETEESSWDERDCGISPCSALPENLT